MISLFALKCTVTASHSGGSLHMLSLAALRSGTSCASLCTCIGVGSASNVDRCDKKLITNGSLYLLRSGE